MSVERGSTVAAYLPVARLTILDLLVANHKAENTNSPRNNIGLSQLCYICPQARRASSKYVVYATACVYRELYGKITARTCSQAHQESRRGEF